MRSLTYLSLFSGIGGLDLGLDRAGWSCAGQIELDPFCRKVLARHWPEVPRHDDVRTAADWWLAEPRPRVHLLAGGPPCQGHSTAGRRQGTGDERWGWPWMRGVADALEPPLILIENVPNLVRTGLVDILRDLAERGFDAWWQRVPAAALGAPHLRRRLFLVAAHPERVELRDEPGWRGGPDRQGTTVAGHDGATWALANAESLGEPLRPAEGQRPGRPSGGGDSLAVADAHSERWNGRPGDLTEAHGRGEPSYGGWWAAEPDVGRVAHGVPGRVDRLRALGNAVVPQVAEYVGRRILDHFHPREAVPTWA